MFENDDEFGVNSFRKDATYTFKANSTRVQIVRYNKDKSKHLQGDFMGIKTKTFEDEKEFIDINIMSENSKDKKISKEGYTGRGEIRYNCLAPYNIKINHKDVIIFIADDNYDIKAGDKFRIEFKDSGLYKGQSCFRGFEIIKI